jgi:hypothetical protein
VKKETAKIPREPEEPLQKFGYGGLPYRCTNCGNLQVYDEQCVLCYINPRIFPLEKVKPEKDEIKVNY